MAEKLLYLPLVFTVIVVLVLEPGTVVVVVTSDNALSFESAVGLDEGVDEEEFSDFSSTMIFLVPSFAPESLLKTSSFLGRCFSEPGISSSLTDTEDDLSRLAILIDLFFLVLASAAPKLLAPIRGFRLDFTLEQFESLLIFRPQLEKLLSVEQVLTFRDP